MNKICRSFLNFFSARRLSEKKICMFVPLLLLFHNVVDFSQIGAPPPYRNILNCLVTDYIEILEAHNNLVLVNKTGIFGQKISKIGLQFESYDFYDAKNARTLVVGLVDSFVDALNDSKRLAPFRPEGKSSDDEVEPCQAPFTAKNVEIRINFIDRCKYSYPAFGEIKYVDYSDGVISYYTGNSHCSGELTLYRQEPLDFARQAIPPLIQFIPPKCRPLGP